MFPIKLKSLKLTQTLFVPKEQTLKQLEDLLKKHMGIEDTDKQIEFCFGSETSVDVNVNNIQISKAP